MEKARGRFAAGLLAALLVATVAAGATEKVPVPEGVVAGNNAFALDLYARLRAQEGNLFLSPYSISTALAMTYAGARGETQKQMAQVLHFGLDQARLHPAFRALMAAITVPTRARMRRAGPPAQMFELHIANALWGQKGYPFVEAFLKTTHENYGAGLREVDFRADTEAARLAINKWVEAQTKEKIKDLIQRGVLDRMTRLVLTNAIYFKSEWQSQFRKEATREGDFTLADGAKVKVPMMRQTRYFPYAETDDLQIAELPYVGGATSMVILLPRKADGLAALEKALNAAALAGWLQGLKHRFLALSMPRFKTTSQFALGATLKQMGMPDAFDGARANFRAMGGTPEENLFISAVVHKAYVDVNEWGTEAAAATAVAMAGTGMPPKPVEFRADRPFLFLIRHRPTGSILFIGRVMNPTK